MWWSTSYFHMSVCPLVLVNRVITSDKGKADVTSLPQGWLMCTHHATLVGTLMYESDILDIWHHLPHKYTSCAIIKCLFLLSYKITTYCDETYDTQIYFSSNLLFCYYSLLVWKMLVCQFTWISCSNTYWIYSDNNISQLQLVMITPAPISFALFILVSPFILTWFNLNPSMDK